VSSFPERLAVLVELATGLLEVKHDPLGELMPGGIWRAGHSGRRMVTTGGNTRFPLFCEWRSRRDLSPAVFVRRVLSSCYCQISGMR
jgi:hypothetical protein